MIEVIAFFAAGAIIVRALCQLNHMTWRTRLLIKIPYVLLALSAFAILISPFWPSDWRDTSYAVLVVAVALQLCIDDRSKNRKAP